MVKTPSTEFFRTDARMAVSTDTIDHTLEVPGLISSPADPVVVAAPDVSVCIAHWNCREHLRLCLQSLYDLPQGVSFEVIVIDNASTDGSAEMIRAAFPQVRLIRNIANLGFSRANNQAAAIAKGRYLFFLNNDTELPPWTLRSLVDHVRANPGVGMIGPRLVGMNGQPQISYRRTPTLAALLHRIGLVRATRLCRRAYYRYRRQEFNDAGIRPVDALMGAAVLLPRTVFERVGGWDEQFAFGVEDLDLSVRVGQIGHLVYFGDVDVIHHGRMSSRANIGYVTGNVAIGYATYLRNRGVSRTLRWLYKALVVLDTPGQCLGKYAQGVVRRLRGQPDRAAKSFDAARGVRHFLTRDLLRFLRA